MKIAQYHQSGSNIKVNPTKISMPGGSGKNIPPVTQGHGNAMMSGTPSRLR